MNLLQVLGSWVGGRQGSRGFRVFGSYGWDEVFQPPDRSSELVLPSRRGAELVIRKIGGPGGSGYGCDLVAVERLKELGRPEPRDDSTVTDFGVLGSVRSIESEARPGEESAEDAVPVLQ
ncbi:hypothetical protein ABT096_25370, partial [Streptomyces sp. NPDC002561]|uniref:hypothetical protein n=1 Tax=Streptomyces sp. NPDC002561 TaxID=3154418 RepID=UPI00331ECC1C